APRIRTLTPQMVRHRRRAWSPDRPQGLDHRATGARDPCRVILPARQPTGPRRCANKTSDGARARLNAAGIAAFNRRRCRAPFGASADDLHTAGLRTLLALNDLELDLGALLEESAVRVVGVDED